MANQLLLNVDLALYRDIHPDATGKVKECAQGTKGPKSTCPFSSSAAQVDMYASDNKKWLNDFTAVFNKMLRCVCACVGVGCGTCVG
jgi:hypothetical protein